MRLEIQNTGGNESGSRLPFPSSVTRLRLFSTITQNTVLNAQNVIVSSRHGLQWTRSVSLQYGRIASSHALFSIAKQNTALSNAPSVAANSRTKKRRIKFVPVPQLGGCPLTPYQHYDAKHRFECPECDDEFTTQAAMEQVLIIFLDLTTTRIFTRTFSTTMQNTV